MPGSTWGPRLNRSRDCRCCNLRKRRVQILAPTPTDPNYLVAVCPTCDMTVGNAEKRMRGM